MPGILVDDETSSEDILTDAELCRRVLDAVQLRIVGPGIGDDIEPELLVGVPGFLPLVDREAAGLAHTSLQPQHLLDLAVIRGKHPRCLRHHPLHPPGVLYQFQNLLAALGRFDRLSGRQPAQRRD